MDNKRNKIFISYGHDEYSELAVAIKEALEKDNAIVWIDKKDIQASQDWEIKIEKGIEESECIILLMTKYSVRRPDGFCLNELSYANANKKRIIPVKINEIIPPISIVRLQYVDMTSYGSMNEEKQTYLEDKIKLIKAVIDGEIILSSNDNDPRKILEKSALANEFLIDKYSQDFVGREWLFEQYDTWVNDEESRVFCLVGNPGSGKSAVASRLCSIKEQIKGIHFCVYNDNDRADAKKIIISLAYHLSCQIPEYNKYLTNHVDLNGIYEKDASTLFNYLFVEPLNQMKDYHETTVIVIDALDEATNQYGTNELVKIISGSFRNTPKWFKLFTTTRPEIDICSRIRDLNPIVLENKVDENNADIRLYYIKRLGQIENEVLDKLVEKAGGNFLYAKVMADDIRRGTLKLSDVDRFPVGISNYYAGYFDRVFENIDNYKKYKPLLSVLICAYEPIKITEYANIIGMSVDSIYDILPKIHVLFPCEEDYIRPIHKSIIDWLIDEMQKCLYFINKSAGHILMANYCLGQLSSKNKYVLSYAVKHCLSCNNEDYLFKASELLQNEELLSKRIARIGQERTINDYINEFIELYNKDEDEGEEVLLSDAFINMFVSNEKLLYNFQLYKKLEQNGFDNVIDEYRKRKTIEMYVGLVKYYYINEKFAKTIELAEEASNLFTEKEEEIKMAEAYNAMALSYRKLADFDKCIEISNNICQVCHGEYNLYEEAIAHLSLGKTYYHRLDLENGEKHLLLSIDCLKQEHDKTSKKDYKHMLTLYIAAFQRELVLMYTWFGDYDKAKYYLDEIEKCYLVINSRDRYYVRYLFASLFFNTRQKKEFDIDKLSKEMAIYAQSYYDKIEVTFFTCLYYFKKDDKNYAYNEHLEKALKEAGEIDSYFEYDEILLLSNMINGKEPFEGMKKWENEDIQKWIKHVYEIIKK